jgi:branched-chain amino acid aminotransferase
VPIIGVRSHAAWLCTSVFDGARAFEGSAPNVDLHCVRVNESAKSLGLKPIVPVETWIGLVHEGRKRFDHDAELCMRPIYYRVRCRPAGSRNHTLGPLALRLAAAKTDGYGGDHALAVSPSQAESASAEAKTGCLYPNNARAKTEAPRVWFRQLPNVRHAWQLAELATANIFMAKNGVVFTPVPNGTFLSGSPAHA